MAPVHPGARRDTDRRRGRGDPRSRRRHRPADSARALTALATELAAQLDESADHPRHGNVGSELWRMGELDRASWYLRTGVRMATKAGLVSDLPRIRLNLARVSVARRNYEKALDQFRRDGRPNRKAARIEPPTSASRGVVV